MRMVQTPLFHFFQRAVQLDPQFRHGPCRLGSIYAEVGPEALMAESTRHAYELREKVSEAGAAVHRGSLLRPV